MSLRHPLFRHICMQTVLVVEKDNPVVCDHSWSLFIPDCNLLWMLSILRPETHSVRSSTYSVDLIPCGRLERISLIATRKRVHDRTLPCGTPSFTLNGYDRVLPTRTYIFLSLRKDTMNFGRCPLNPRS